MDISRASNFERFIFDLTGRDSALLRTLWQAVDGGSEFRLADTPLHEKIREFGFVSGSSTHANRIATIRDIYKRFGVMIDTHTADGVKVGLEHREPGVPLICLETAQPVKFAEVLREALGREPDCPESCRGLEQLPQRFETMPNDAQAVKNYIAHHGA